MNDKPVKILISLADSPKSHLYKDALNYPDVNTVAAYLPDYDDSYCGLLIAGGVDVEPELYGECANGSEKTDSLRDKCEFALIERFSKANKPIFGICRGVQILNVYFGGTLVGDLPKSHPHRLPGEDMYHKIKIDKNSILSGFFGDEITVNSLHHQAVKDIAEGFNVSARSSSDGVIEAIEHSDKPWFGVQFHPERLINNPLSPTDARPLFDYFLSLCRSYGGVQKAPSLSHFRNPLI